MRPRRSVILAIRPGTRKLKFTVRIDGELADYGTKYFDGKWSKEKMEKILGTVRRLLMKYEPKKITMSLPHPSRRSPGLDQLIKKLLSLKKRYFKKEGVRIELTE